MDKIDRLLAERGQLADLVDSGFENKSTGQSPFAADQAAAQRAQLVQRKEAGEAAPEPVRATTVWDKIGSIFGRKKEDARAAYFRLLRKVEFEGVPLKESEVAILAESMQVAGITESMAASHRAAIKKLREAQEAASKLREVDARGNLIQRAIDDLAERAKPLLAEEKRLVTAHRDALIERQICLMGCSGLQGATEQVAAIFGEVV